MDERGKGWCGWSWWEFTRSATNLLTAEASGLAYERAGQA